MRPPRAGPGVRSRRGWLSRRPLAAVIWFGAGRATPAARLKGGFVVTAFAGRGGDAVPLGTGDPLFPGDRLQLSYSAERAGHDPVECI